MGDPLGVLLQTDDPLRRGRIRRIAGVAGAVIQILRHGRKYPHRAAIVVQAAHLHRVFSDTVGLTIHDYIQRRQLTESAKLLVFSCKPIVQIAFLSGYQSQQAFTNAFTAM